MKSIKSLKRIGSQKPDGPTAAGLQEYRAEHSSRGKNQDQDRDIEVLSLSSVSRKDSILRLLITELLVSRQYFHSLGLRLCLVLVLVSVLAVSVSVLVLLLLSRS